MRLPKNSFSTLIRSELCVPAPAEGLKCGIGQQICCSQWFPAEHSRGQFQMSDRRNARHWILTTGMYKRKLFKQPAEGSGWSDTASAARQRSHAHPERPWRRIHRWLGGIDELLSPLEKRVKHGQITRLFLFLKLWKLRVLQFEFHKRKFRRKLLFSQGHCLLDISEYDLFQFHIMHSPKQLVDYTKSRRWINLFVERGV